MVDLVETSTCEFYIWMKLNRDSEVRMLKSEHTVQQNSAIQYYELGIHTVGCLQILNVSILVPDSETSVEKIMQFIILKLR